MKRHAATNGNASIDWQNVPNPKINATKHAHYENGRDQGERHCDLPISAA